jgi:muconate cycloisomerase
MPKVKSFEVYSVEIPFKKPFRHSAAVRSSSYSIFLKCITDSGVFGFGECLPREYVTGESRDGAFNMLCDRILPNLIGKSFEDYESVKSFLSACDGKAPDNWVGPAVPQTSAWAAVDLALLDSFGKVFSQHVVEEDSSIAPHLRYSAVASTDRGLSLVRRALKIMMYGIRQVKLKVDDDDFGIDSVAMLKKIVGRDVDIRIDANMAWTRESAAEKMAELAGHGIHSFEQPLPKGRLDDMAWLVRETGLSVMADEDVNDRDSLKELIDKKACTAVNLRISKCGGLIAVLKRCREALDAGLVIQIGCQVGESSLLSAAQLALISQVPEVTYLEGCYGLHLLREDPATPLLQLSRGGKPPEQTKGPGLGVQIEEESMRRFVKKVETV